MENDCPSPLPETTKALSVYFAGKKKEKLEIDTIFFRSPFFLFMMDFLRIILFTFFPLLAEKHFIYHHTIGGEREKVFLFKPTQ